jgi:hypothetical protein
LAKHEKLTSNSLAKQLGILPLGARVSAAHLLHREEVEGHKNNFVSISGFLM